MIIYFCIVTAIALGIIVAASFEYDGGDAIFYTILLWGLFGFVPSVAIDYESKALELPKMNYVVTKLPYSRMIVLPKETNPKLEETLTFTFEKNLEISKIDSLKFGFQKIKRYNMWGYEIHNSIQVDFKK